MDPRRKSTVQYQVKVLEVTKICRSAINFIDSTEGKNAKQMVAKFLKKAVLFSKNILQKKNSIFVVDEVTEFVTYFKQVASIFPFNDYST